MDSLPSEIGQLKYLQSLSLSHNNLRKLPETLSTLSRLRVLHLHHNQLTTLPHGLMFITGLADLSLRDNPLVMRFIRDMELQPASLLELSARAVKLHSLPCPEDEIPASLVRHTDLGLLYSSSLPISGTIVPHLEIALYFPAGKKSVTHTFLQ